MMTTVTIGKTSKGDRVWLQALETHTAGVWTGGVRYNTEFDGDTIVLTLSEEGKRKVTNSKGGIIDMVGKKITDWADGSEFADVYYGESFIEIKRQR